MGLFGLGTPELAVIAGVALLILGPDQVKKMAKDIGKVSAELKQARSLSEAVLAARREAIRLRQTGTLVPDSFCGRVQHSTIIWKGRLFVFGGRGDGVMLRDFWEFSLNAGYWVDQSHTVPLRMKARCGHTALLVGTRMVIVGGTIRYDEIRSDEIRYAHGGQIR